MHSSQMNLKFKSKSILIKYFKRFNYKKQWDSHNAFISFFYCLPCRYFSNLSTLYSYLESDKNNLIETKLNSIVKSKEINQTPNQDELNNSVIRNFENDSALDKNTIQYWRTFLKQWIKEKSSSEDANLVKEIQKLVEITNLPRHIISKEISEIKSGIGKDGSYSHANKMYVRSKIQNFNGIKIEKKLKEEILKETGWSRRQLSQFIYLERLKQKDANFKENEFQMTQNDQEINENLIFDNRNKILNDIEKKKFILQWLILNPGKPSTVQRKWLRKITQWPPHKLNAFIIYHTINNNKPIIENHQNLHSKFRLKNFKKEISPTVKTEIQLWLIENNYESPTQTEFESLRNKYQLTKHQLRYQLSKMKLVHYPIMESDREFIKKWAIDNEFRKPCNEEIHILSELTHGSNKQQIIKIIESFKRQFKPKQQLPKCDIYPK